MRAKHGEWHYGHRVGWLRAAVLGANDGLVSVASLMVGVAAGGANGQTLMLTGVAGLVAGAMSMAAGEYVSVSSQADSESADIAREKAELKATPESELIELTAVYVKRGLTNALAQEVAAQLTAVDALAAHTQDELGITATMQARPVQAAISSAAAFAAGAGVPVATAALAAPEQLLIAMGAGTAATLLALGAIAAQVGGASMVKGAARVTFWGMIAVAVTALAGKYFGA